MLVGPNGEATVAAIVAVGTVEACEALEAFEAIMARECSEYILVIDN